MLAGSIKKNQNESFARFALAPADALAKYLWGVCLYANRVITASQIVLCPNAVHHLKVKIPMPMKIGAVLAVVEQDLQLIERLRRFVAENTCCTVKIARSSQEAILYLRGVGVYADRSEYPLPDLIILDPESETGADLEVLSWLRTNEEFARMTVTILSARTRPAMRLPYIVDEFCFVINRDSFDGLVDTVYRSAMRNSVENVLPGYQRVRISRRTKGLAKDATTDSLPSPWFPRYRSGIV
jgi:CheY-like chemotaxis protein